MGKRMRNVQEQDADERSRNRATWMVVATVVALLFAAAHALWNRAAGFGHGDTNPLDRFLRSQIAQIGSDRTKPSEARVVHEPTPVDPAKLTFERALTGHDTRPEVLAALEAAERENEHLTTVSPLKARTRGSVDPNAAPIPANLAASSAALKLERSSAHDKLVAAALPKPSKDAARSGGATEGDFLLHVISYENKAPAEALARALRERGHDAFVAAGERDGRGRYYRVRIGSFASKQTADAYRRAFEARERMNTIVIRRQDAE